MEILSPVNKRSGGLHTYREERKSLLCSDVHLIELDLLRGGERPGWEVNDPPIDSDYMVLVNRAFRGNVRQSGIWPVALNEPLPICPVSLLPPDPDVPLHLSEVLTNVYRRAAYARRIDYTSPVPPPPPAAGDAALAGHIPGTGLKARRPDERHMRQHQTAAPVRQHVHLSYG